QIRGQPADPRDDVHALGVIWYQMLVADLRVAPARPSHWQHELLTRGVKACAISLLASCVSAEPSDRPADAGRLAERLRGLLRRDTPTQERTERMTALAPSRASQVSISTAGAPWVPRSEAPPSASRPTEVVPRLSRV